MPSTISRRFVGIVCVGALLALGLWQRRAISQTFVWAYDIKFKAAGTGAVARTMMVKERETININDFGIGDPTAAINILEGGRVSQLPYIDPYVWFRMDTGITGAWATTALVGAKQEVTTLTRTTTGTVVVGGVETTALAGQLRFQDNPVGLLIEPTRTQSISAPDAPVSQTGLALGVANYYLRIEGTGSIAVALATGTATGLPCTATAASPCAFAFSVAGTVNTTVSGTVTFAQLENGNIPTSRIHTAITRNVDSVSFAHTPRSGHDWLIAVRAKPNFGLPWAPDLEGRGLFTLGDSTSTANVAFAYFGTDTALRFQVNDNTNTAKSIATSGAQPGVFIGNVEHDFWFYGAADGTIETWIDGQKTIPIAGGTGTGIITTMPANLRPGIANTVVLNGVVSDFRLYYDVQPDRLPQPQWTRTTTANTVVCIGDSITGGAGITGVTTPYPATLQTTLSTGSTGAWTVLNAGVGGDFTWQTLLRWRAGVRRQTQKWVVLFSGTNDINQGSQTAATAWLNLTKIATQVRSDGKSLVLVTLIPRNANTAAMDAERVKLNNSIRAYCAAGGAVCVDAFPDYDNGDGHTLKVAYDSGDGTHPNQAGMDHLAALVAAAIPH